VWTTIDLFKESFEHVSYAHWIKCV
jgi:hypothetical protein